MGPPGQHSTFPSVVPAQSFFLSDNMQLWILINCWNTLRLAHSPNELVQNCSNHAHVTWESGVPWGVQDICHKFPCLSGAVGTCYDSKISNSGANGLYMWSIFQTEDGYRPVCHGTALQKLHSPSLPVDIPFSRLTAHFFFTPSFTEFTRRLMTFPRSLAY